MTSSINIDVKNFDLKHEKKSSGIPKNLKNEITKFNKKQTEKRKLNQTITKSIIDTNLGINTNNTQRCFVRENKSNYTSNTSYAPKRDVSFPPTANVIDIKDKLEPPRIETTTKHYKHISHEPSILDRR
jgi:hypothetical protein